ncbi:hypothetical protein HK097_009797 [Rhizophlyctis rosea]|uniref:ABC transporter domain-containing protein n=1 Tax=Rhizophlyctis rosea TaxID=64517 RepID=A0AAD5S8E5_9FUNG|nr:hypothetical protein HK097_009797 [Rhizophlyctis rosea]
MIVMSLPGIALTTKERGVRNAKQFAGVAGCADRGAECLKAKSMREILTAVEHDDYGGGAVAADSFKTMLPVVDGTDVVDSPWNIMQNPFHMQGIQVMLGGMSNETSFMIEAVHKGELHAPNFNVITDAMFGRATRAARNVYNTEEHGFLGDRQPYLTDMTSDWLFHCPLRQVVNTATTFASSPVVWQYVIEAPWTGGVEDAVGLVCGQQACHSTDVTMVFWKAADEPTAAVTSQFRGYMRSFMQANITNINVLSSNGATSPSWPTYSLDSHHLMRFPNPAKLQYPLPYIPVVEPSHPRDKYCNYWDDNGYDHSPDPAHPKIITATPVDNPNISDALLGALFVFFLLAIGLQVFLLILGYCLKNTMGKFFAAVEKEAADEAQMFRKERNLRALESGGSGPPGIVITDTDHRPTPITLECRKLEYRVADRDDGKLLVSDLSFECPPGTMTALMGSSGAGKTTLLSLMNRRLDSPRAQQQILIGGRPLTKISARRFRYITGFVAQYDAPYYGLTPREALMYNAMLELPASMTRAAKARRVNSILKELNLLVCADVVMCRPEENRGGISGGQMRRLSIAVALLRRPSVLFLDEPTSGLDAKSSLDVARVLQRLAKNGYTIICSIHQPRKEMYHMFSQILVLIHGRMLFAGPPALSIRHFVNLKKKLVPKLAKSPNSDALPNGEERPSAEDDERDAEGNPADLVLDVAGAIKRDDVEEAVSHFKPMGRHSEMMSINTGLGSLYMNRRSRRNVPSLDSRLTFNLPTFASSPTISIPDFNASSTTLNLDADRPGLRREFSEDTLFGDLGMPQHNINPTPTSATFGALPPTPSMEIPAPEDRLASPLAAAAESPANITTLKDLADPTRARKTVNNTAGFFDIFRQIFIINARWWRKRPLIRKINMTIVSLCGIWFMALVQRRSGSDAIALMMQTKGLALACIGLPALKNIGISFDFYEDFDIYLFDLQNGTTSPTIFFLHRLIYETAISTFEALICGLFNYLILGCTPEVTRIFSAVAIFVLYYNTTTGIFTLIYSSPAGRPEARSISFIVQGILALCSGIWIKKGDSSVYDVVAWLQYINPAYWATAQLVRINASGKGDCLVTEDGICKAAVGDGIVEQARADWIHPWTAVAALLAIWIAVRFIQWVNLFLQSRWGRIKMWIGYKWETRKTKKAEVETLQT